MPKKSSLFLRLLLFAALLLFALFFPDRSLTVRVFLFGAATLGLSFFLSVCREACLCSASFLGIGALTAALISHGSLHPFSLFSAFLGSVLFSSLIALLVGSFLLRLEGDLFSLGSFCFSEALRVVLEGLPFTGGARGCDLACWEPMPLSAFLFFLFVFLLLAFLKGSSFSLFASAVNDAPLGASAVGVSVHRVRMKGFCLMAAICGGAGFFYASVSGILLPADNAYLRSCDLLASAVLGGENNLVGGLFASLLLSVGEVAFSSLAGVRLLLLAGIFLLFSLKSGKRGRKSL